MEEEEKSFGGRSTFDGTNRSLTGIIEALNLFNELSGLEMNVSKSALYLGGSTRRNHSIQLGHGFREGEFPFRYLGLPLMCRRLRMSEFTPLLDAITKRFSSWQSRSLSYAGRLQLVKSVIGSMINFWFTAFCLPKLCIKKVEQMCQQFLWSGQIANRCQHKVAWRQVCTAKEKGGLGIRDFGLWNKTLLLKLIWRLYNNRESLWSQWIHKHYLKRECFWAIQKKQHDSWLWHTLLSLRPVAQRFLSCTVVNGEHSSFWYDRWLGHRRLEEAGGSDRFLKLGIPKHASVQDTMKLGIWQNRRRASMARTEDVHSIMERVLNQNPPDPTAGNDTWSWSVDDVDRQFSASYTWSCLATEGPNLSWTQAVWYKGNIPRFAFLFWLAHLNKLPTRERLYAWGCSELLVCGLCDTHMETRDHILLSCRYGEIVWKEVTRRLLGTPCLFNDWGSLISWLLSSDGRTPRLLKMLSIQVTIYKIWQTRNARTHDQDWPSGQILFRAIDRTVRDTLLAHHRSKKYTTLLQTWLRLE